MPKRRANGEGTIRKRKDGRWEGRYTAGHDPETGKAISKNVLGHSQAEVLEKLKDAIALSAKTSISKYSDYTVGQWAQTWYDEYAKPNVRESTALYYKNYIDNHIVPNIGDIKLKKLSTMDIQRFYNKMRIIPYNPCNGCRIPAKEKKEMVIVPTDKIKAYLDQAEEYGVFAIFYLEFTSGLRRGELVALLWDDLDAEHRTISVTKTVNRMGKELVVNEPKTPNSVRRVTIPQQTVDVLVREHEKHPDNPYMFPSPKTGGMYDPNTIRRIHKKLLERAGIDKNVRFHDLRHTFTTVMLQNGVDPKTLSTMLGHYSTAFTLDVYSHVTDQMQRQAADKMGSFMQGIL